MIKINLLSEGKRPAAVRRARSSSQTLPTDLGQILLVGIVLLALIGCLGYWLLNRRAIAEKNDQLAVAQEEYDRLEPIIREVEAYKVKKAELEHKIEVITGLKANQHGPVRVMDEISRAVPELLWLTELEMNASKIKLKGQAYNNNAIASFDENLDRVPEFQEPEFRETRLGRSDIYDFSIDLGYNLTPLSADPAANASQSEAGGVVDGDGGAVAGAGD